jgi:hypothetical protein
MLLRAKPHVQIVELYVIRHFDRDHEIVIY